MRRNLAYLAALISAAAAIFLLFSNLPRGTAAREAEVHAASTSASGIVAAPGRVEPLSEEIEIGSELNGKLREVPVEEGDRIRKGQILAVLENADHAARVALAEAQIAQKEAAEQRLLNGSRSEERREAEAALTEARAVLANAEADVSRRRDLFRTGDISRADLDRWEREVAVAKARFEASKERRELVERATRDEDIAGIRAELAQARAQLSESRAILAKTFLRSPINGVVLRKHLKAGESVSVERGDRIVTIGDDSRLRVRVDVDEADVARVSIGQSAYVTAEAYGKRRFTGRVVQIGQILGRKNIRTDEPTERVDTKILETLVELDPGQRLPAGLRVDCFLGGA